MPLCKTAGGSFMLLDLDGTMNNCDDEVTSNFKTQFAAFPWRSSRTTATTVPSRWSTRSTPRRAGRAHPDLRRRMHDDRRQ